jgi:hypothetical protein
VVREDGVAADFAAIYPAGIEISRDSQYEYLASVGSALGELGSLIAARLVRAGVGAYRCR